jgi:tetratricopeptide (TPR) repeat protein
MRTRTRWLALTALTAVLSANDVPAAPTEDDATPFGTALVAGERALADGKLDEARRQVDRALERDAKSPRAWNLRARWAEAAKDADEQAYALHRLHALLQAQKAPGSEVAAVRKRLEAADPVAKDLLGLDKTFVDRLFALAKEYEKAKRPHAAIRVYRQVLSIAPDRADVEAAIQRVSSAPDPSLAESAKPKDLLADVSEEWIAKHDAKHATWETRARIERANYVTETNAGYAVLVRAAEAMEQMNAFYRRFFRYGTEKDGKSVPKIALHLFKTHDEYLKLGKGPPVEWSGGQFTGDSVETSVDGGFESCVGTLFHEAAHQFVSLATSAAGWMNEGLASYFEGSRILANGTVVTNLPATHRLFPLVERMERGWMTSSADGIDPAKPSASDPPKAPTFRIVLENEYAWGPPWYAPTWGVVYWLWNAQDPADGRFLYRDVFRGYVDASGGKVGKSAIQAFEEVVLAHPAAPTKGVPEAKANKVRLPKTVDEVDEVWKDWLVALRDEQIGTAKPDRPWLAWARNAIVRKDWDDALELFERGLERTPEDVDLLLECADLLAGRMKNADRAAKLATEALRVLEAAPAPDAKRIAAIEARLDALDPRRASLERTNAELAAAAVSIAKRYADAGRPLMTMHAARTFSGDLGVPGLDALYEQAARSSGKTLALWRLAYDERSLAGWSPGSESVFRPYGTLLRAVFGEVEPDRWDAATLDCELVTSGDYSIEAEVHAEKGANALCGLVFGKKTATSYHALVLYPSGWVDLASFVGAGTPKVWRHEPLPRSTEPWRRLRVDVAGSSVDVSLDGRPLATQDYGDPDVLRGRFGLLAGRGRCEFRNVRTLSRARNDLGGAIERRLRLERARAAGRKPGDPWLGEVPPFPSSATWVQGKRERWDERGFVPTLLVLWARRQNDVMPLHAWLSDVAKRHADAGLEVVSVSQNDHPARLAEYLAKHAFPGAVANDHVDPRKSGFGDTFDAFGIGTRYELPRIVLLDLDGRVVWEGAPGFTVGVPWTPGTPSYLDTPLEELLAKRNAVRLRAWLADARGEADRESVRSGAIDARLGTRLAAARSLPGDVVPEVAWFAPRAKAIEDALAAFDATADAIVAKGGDPAVETLAAWGAALGKPVDGKSRGLRRAAQGAAASSWKTVLGLVERARKDLAGGATLDAATAPLLARLPTLAGRFPKALAETLKAALDAGDAAAAGKALEEAPRLPARWLAADVLAL